MAVFMCKMCGGNLETNGTTKVIECEYCGTKQTLPSMDNEKKINLFNRANRLRFANEFDKAAGVYESIVAEFPEEAEAYWGLCLCKYGIEYVDDPATAKKIPTCHRTSYDGILNDSNFKMALEYADVVAQKLYRDEAKEIDRLQQSILEIAKNEKPYDIFICYKETAEDGQRTKDSVLAQDIYDALTAKGYKVFFARITLEEKLGQEYEPYIFSALQSAKIMLAIGTKHEYFNAVWVKNEWSRFLDIMKIDKEKVLIPCYADIDAYDMPQEFKNLQGQDMNKIGFLQDLIRGIGKILGTYANIANNDYTDKISSECSALVHRGNLELEDGDFKKAESCFERALDINPSDAHAYLGKFLSLVHVSSLADFDDKVCWLDNEKEFKRAEQFADPSLAEELRYFRESNNLKLERLRFINAIKQVAEKKAKTESIYQNAINHLYGNNLNDINFAINAFNTILDYKDSKDKLEECKHQKSRLLEEKSKADKKNADNAAYEEAIKLADKAITPHDYIKASDILIRTGREDYIRLAEEYKEKAKQLEKKIKKQRNAGPISFAVNIALIITVFIIVALLFNFSSYDAKKIAYYGCASIGFICMVFTGGNTEAMKEVWASCSSILWLISSVGFIIFSFAELGLSGFFNCLSFLVLLVVWNIVACILGGIVGAIIAKII